MDALSNSVWHLDVPFEAFPTWDYTVRLWVRDHNPLWDQSAPVEWHELSPMEFIYRDEQYKQRVSVLQYAPPNPCGDTIWGIYNHQSKSVEWMQRLPNQNFQQGCLAQVAETPPKTYDISRTPAEHDQAGHIHWFKLDRQLYPRTWIKRISWPGQKWGEFWGPFAPDSNGSLLRPRYYSVSEVRVKFKGTDYKALKVNIFGISGTDPSIVVREALIFIDKIGMYNRYLSLTTTKKPVPPLPPSTTLFLQIAGLNDVSFSGPHRHSS